MRSMTMILMSLSNIGSVWVKNRNLISSFLKLFAFFLLNFRTGAPSKKLVLAISSAGQSLTLATSKKTGKTVTTLGAPGPISNTPGSLAYYEICNNTKNNGWTVVRDKEVGVGPHAYHDDQLVFYDDVENIRSKAQYIRKMGLGGGMIWTLDLDDFSGSCGCGRYPLLTTLSQEIANVGGKSIGNCT